MKGKVKLSRSEVILTREGEQRPIGLNIRRAGNTNWHWIVLTPEDVKALIVELVGTLP